MRTFNRYIEFGDFDNPVRENEIWMSSFSLDRNGYFDAGYRFRLNTFSMLDYWLPFWKVKKYQFYDVVKWNEWFYQTPKSTKYLASIFFRIDVDEVIHDRKVYGFS